MSDPDEGLSLPEIVALVRGERHRGGERGPDAGSRAVESSKLPRPAKNWANRQMQVVRGFTSGILRFLTGAPVNTRKAKSAVEQTVSQTAETATQAVAAVKRVISSGNESIVTALPASVPSGNRGAPSRSSMPIEPTVPARQVSRLRQRSARSCHLASAAA